MKVIIFGATGMVGQGVLRECLRDPEVERVLAVGRRSTGQMHPKLQELVHADMTDFSSVERELTGFDACFFCLGVSSLGMAEDAYRRITCDLTLAAATPLARLNPWMTFVYVTGVGTDSTEKGSVMWARIKSATENALLRLPFRAAYMFRPSLIQPLHGVRSKTPLVQTFYTLARPLMGLLRAALPDRITTTEEIGRAMINVVKTQPVERICEPKDIVRLGRA